MIRILVETEDKSHTYFVPHLNEPFHSTHGAIQESMHIFINAGLLYLNKKNIKIFEVGFGTGLNALLSYKNIKQEQSIEYHCIEKYPLNIEEIKKLNYCKIIDENLEDFYEELHACQWESLNQLCKNFALRKICEDLTLWHPKVDEKYDLIFYDAFSPDKQSELWTENIFEKIASITSTNGVLTTYSSKGIVKRALKNAGFIITKLNGPPGKRDMIRAIKC